VKRICFRFKGTENCPTIEGDERMIFISGMYIHPNCSDNPFFANCALIVQARYCEHRYYARFCCESCTRAGQLSPQGDHLLYSLSENGDDGSQSVFKRNSRHARDLVKH
jgi:hypothetical protein